MRQYVIFFKVYHLILTSKVILQFICCTFQGMCLRISSFFGSMESTRGLYNLHFCLHCHPLFNPSSIISMTSFSKDTSIPTLENIFFYALDVKTKKIIIRMNDFEKTFFKVQSTKNRLQLHFFIYHKYQCVVR